MIDKFLQPITGIIDKLVPDKTKKMELVLTNFLILLRMDLNHLITKEKGYQ